MPVMMGGADAGRGVSNVGTTLISVRVLFLPKYFMKVYSSLLWFHIPQSEQCSSLADLNMVCSVCSAYISRSLPAFLHSRMLRSQAGFFSGAPCSTWWSTEMQEVGQGGPLA